MNREIKEGNLLIAEFMGVTKLSFGWVAIEGRRYAYQDQHYPSTLKYHNSWAWLMPVITKIGDIHNQADGELLTEIEEANLPMFNTSIFCHFDELYKRVLSFIQWYQQNKLKPNE